MNPEEPNKIDVFCNRLKNIGIDIKLGGNYPWIYLDYINGIRVTETLSADHGFTMAWYPKHPGDDYRFNDIEKTFKLIRSYSNDFDKYIDRVREQLVCNATEQYKENNITYDYSNEQIQTHLRYFRHCMRTELSEYKALLFFQDYLNGDFIINKTI